MKTKNRILSILLAAIMILSIVPFSVFAEESEITEVGTWQELLNAVNSDKTYIKLMNPIEDIVPDDELPTKHRLVFDGGVDYVLDLNGYNLEVLNHVNEFYTSEFSMIEVSNSSKIEILDGSLVFDNYYAKSNRKAQGVVAVEDESTLIATHVDMRNKYTGTVVFASDDASVTLDGGEYIVQNGFALYLTNSASLTLDGDIYIHTVMGDGAFTASVDGYGALYSESNGKLTINNAFFKSGIQVSSSQISAFSTSTHEVTVNGKKLTEDIFEGTNTEAKQQNKEYYWYSWTGCSLMQTENSSFTNPIKVISYEKKYPITVESGIAMVGGVPATEASYGQEVTVVAHTPEAGMEFVRWGTSGVTLANDYSASTTFTMPAAPVYIAAYYGKESVKSVSVTVGDMIVGEKAYATEITVDGGTKLESVEWYEDLIKMEENDIFKPGKAYEMKILVYPPDEHKFGDTVTATVNGTQATVNSDSGYAKIGYKFNALPENPFPVVYNTQTAQLGIGGLLELETTLMSSQSAEFKTAFEAGTVTYQWYKDGEAIKGATGPVYNFKAEDNGSRFFVTVTAGGKTAWGSSHKCYNQLFQIYLNASNFIAGGRAPQISSATPGVSINPESLIICEGHDKPALDIQKTVLVPGKTYLVIGTLVQTGEANIPYNAKVYVNDVLMEDKVDGIYRFFYKFTVPEADFPVYYKTNGEVGIGVTLTVDTATMCAESTAFKHAVDIQTANPTYQTVFYQWYKNGEPINGATKESYTVKTTDRDSYINCKVTLVDGKFGIGEQHVITNVVTVINVKMSYPKNGDTRLVNGISADGVGKIQIMWWPKETQVEMQGSDTYVEGTVYEFYILFSVKDGFVFADAADRTVYAYGKEVTHVSGYAYTGEVTAIHKHQYSDTVWDYDGYCHWQPCIVPNCPDPNEDWEMYTEHTGGTATCKTKGECAICGAEYLADHDFSVPDYQYVDEMKCANFCENCDLWIDWSYHEGGVSDCQHKSVCEICHHEYGDFAPCSGGTATCTEKAKCATCREEYGELAAHAHGTEFKSDANEHWNECACGDKANKAAHTDSNNDGKCDTCEYQMSTTPDNPDNPNNTPDNPNNTPDDPSDDKDGLGTGAIVGIVIGSALVVGIGGFALFWFVIKKKSFADLIAVFKKK